MNDALLEHALDAAHRAAVAASRLIEQYQERGNWNVSFKSDDSPVTEVDVAVEKVIRDILHEALPQAAFFGEETGESSAVDRTDMASFDIGSSELCWLVDPIDGTKSFIRGMRYFSTQIALEIDGQLALGVSNAPAYGECLAVRSGGGVQLNGTQVQVRAGIDTVTDAFLSTGNLTSLARDTERWSRFGRIVADARRVRGYGDFCHYHQLCCGQSDLIIESDVNILDIAALSVAVREAGGVITDLQGRAIDRSTRSVLAAGSAELHAHVLNELR